MTIHQAKGLEFPVVAVGSLDRQVSSTEEIDKTLQRFYRGKQSEPADKIPLFDYMRLYYVAFSRARDLLVLTGESAEKNLVQVQRAGSGLTSVAGGPGRFARHREFRKEQAGSN
jgi:ATP-dependent exoDNAse (exonuclease V) beta subunit